MNLRRAKLPYDYVILVLQGGGALGAYQAGVFEGMTEAGYLPDWVTGVSMGAINGALIAGNPPKRRISTCAASSVYARRHAGSLERLRRRSVAANPGTAR
jgi:predicted acylesterase/phospholipase RssA